MGRVSELAATLEEAEKIKRDYLPGYDETASFLVSQAFDTVFKDDLTINQMNGLKVIMDEYFVLKRQNIDLRFKVSIGDLSRSIQEIAGEKDGN